MVIKQFQQAFKKPTKMISFKSGSDPSYVDQQGAKYREEVLWLLKPQDLTPAPGNLPTDESFGSVPLDHRNNLPVPKSPLSPDSNGMSEDAPTQHHLGQQALYGVDEVKAVTGPAPALSSKLNQLSSVPNLPNSQNLASTVDANETKPTETSVQVPNHASHFFGKTTLANDAPYTQEPTGSQTHAQNPTSATFVCKTQPLTGTSAVSEEEEDTSPCISTREHVIRAWKKADDSVQGTDRTKQVEPFWNCFEKHLKKGAFWRIEDGQYGAVASADPEVSFYIVYHPGLLLDRRYFVQRYRCKDGPISEALSKYILVEPAYFEKEAKYKPSQDDLAKYEVLQVGLVQKR